MCPDRVGRSDADFGRGLHGISGGLEGRDGRHVDLGDVGRIGS